MVWKYFYETRHQWGEILIMKKKDFSESVYKLRDVKMESFENTNLFETYIKTKEFKKIYNGTLWAEGPCYIPHKNILVWSRTNVLDLNLYN